MKTYCSPGTIHRDDYNIYRWWPYGGYNTNGAYLLICRNIELYLLQQNNDPHVVCVVDDFGNLVRKPT